MFGTRHGREEVLGGGGSPVGLFVDGRRGGKPLNQIRQINTVNWENRTQKGMGELSPSQWAGGVKVLPGEAGDTHAPCETGATSQNKRRSKGSRGSEKGRRKDCVTCNLASQKEGRGQKMWVWESRF